MKKNNTSLTNLKKIIGSQKSTKKRKKPFNFQFNTIGNHSPHHKNNILLIKGKSFIENPPVDILNFNKRINEKSSVYSVAQWKKDFKRSRIYKKISCEYPSINFVKKPKRNIKNNYAFSPTNNYNVFSGIRFKPFASFEEENSKGNNSLNKSKKTKGSDKEKL